MSENVAWVVGVNLFVFIIAVTSTINHAMSNRHATRMKQMEYDNHTLIEEKVA